jgi:transcriptional regulator with GAF, ATPase, and Fis domain
MTVEREFSLAAGRRPVDITPGMVRGMFLRNDPQQTVNRVAGVAVDIFRCDAAAVSLLEQGVMRTAASTAPAAQRAGDLQIRCSEGPSVDAVVDRRHSVVDDLRVEGRWRFWAPQAAQLGWRSVVSVSLTDENTSGVVNLYSRTPRAFAADELASAEVFAQHAALALAIAQERAHLVAAVNTRTVIGQAQGILMQRYDIDANQAFTVMRRYSSHSNRKLRDIAEVILTHRGLPAQPPGGARS